MTCSEAAWIIGSSSRIMDASCLTDPSCVSQSMKLPFPGLRLKSQMRNTVKLSKGSCVNLSSLGS